MHPIARACRLFAAFLLSCTCLWLSAAQPGSDPATVQAGTVEGRVFNAITGSALGRALVAVEGTNLQVLTDDGGAFRLSGVAAGEVRLGASYVGLERRTATVRVPPGGSVRHEFELAPAVVGAPRLEGEIVKLQEFNVVADREMSAQAVAMNEQRFAPNLKNVVSLDEYGDQGDETIMNFLRFLPSVSIADDAVGAGSVSLRGFPDSNTEVTVDGGEFASARTANTRTVVLIEVPMSNISRVEVTKVPTPDMSASGLGGSINLISKRGHEVRRPQFNYQVSTQFHNLAGVRLDTVRPNHLPSVSPRRIEPSFSFSYQHPVNRSLALTVGGARTWRIKEMLSGDHADETSTWDLVRLVQTASDWQNLAQVLKTSSGNVGADWRLTPKDTLTASFQYRETHNITTRSRFVANYGAGASGDSTHTQGAATGVGSVTQGSNSVMWDRLNQNRHLSVKYGHRGDRWRIDLAGSRSKADGWLFDIDRGSFFATPATITQLVLRGDGIPSSGGNLPTRYSAVTRAGVPVDVYDGANYSIDSAQSSQDRFRSLKSSGRLDVTREAIGPWRLSVKTGIGMRRDEKDSRRNSMTWAFRPNGAADVASRLARNFDVFDDAFNASAPTIYGRPMRWISQAKVHRLYQQHPSWFVPNETQAHQNRVNNSRRFIETISSAYLRTDARLWRDRLWLVGGVRFERTETEGWGPLNDVFAIYQRDANGNFVRNAAGQRILITTDALAQARLRFREREAYGSNDYQGFYPSLNATYNLTDQLLVRGAYARTIGRPNTSFISPGTTISDPEAANPTITVSNTGLRPWTADSFDLSLESYFLKGGFGSVGVFHKSIRNFFGSLRTAATPELLETYGLGNDPSYLVYDLSTRINAGDATVEGVELSYRQTLGFLPAWARGLQIFANGTRMWLSGSSTADFSGFNSRSCAGGINLIRPRYYVKLTVQYQGEVRRGLMATSATVPAGTYNYLAARTQWGLSAQYSFSKRYALFAAANDIGGGESRALRYAPGTPGYARPGRVQENGWYTTVGIKGQF